MGRNELLLVEYFLTLQRLRIAVENSDKGAEARSYCSIGNCLRAMIQPDKALECYNRVRLRDRRKDEEERERKGGGREGEREKVGERARGKE